MEKEIKKKDIDLKYIFGILIFWIGCGLLVQIFIDFLFYEVQINPLGILIPFILIPLGIYMMKTARSTTPVGESYAPAAILRGGLR